MIGKEYFHCTRNSGSSTNHMRASFYRRERKLRNVDTDVQAVIPTNLLRGRASTMVTKISACTKLLPRTSLPAGNVFYVRGETRAHLAASLRLWLYHLMTKWAYVPYVFHIHKDGYREYKRSYNGMSQIIISVRLLRFTT